MRIDISYEPTSRFGCGDSEWYWFARIIGDRIVNGYRERWLSAEGMSQVSAWDAVANMLEMR